MIAAAAANLGASRWFARRVPVAAVTMTWRESRREAGALLGLGVSFMGATLPSTGTTYVVQSVLTRRFGVAGLGMYQAAFGVSGSRAKRPQNSAIGPPITARSSGVTRPL